MKTAIITGVSHGLGAVTARVFLDHGWQVIGTGRSDRPAELPEAILYHQFDAADPQAVAGFWNAILQTITDDVCLVNNAGGYVAGALQNADAEDFQRQMASNYFGGVYMTQEFVKHVAAGRVINILSSGALQPHAEQSAYGASKAAAMHFFQAIRRELPASKYRITNIYPSDIATHGDNDKAINPQDLARFVVEQAESATSFYLSDITMYPAPHA